MFRSVFFLVMLFVSANVFAADVSDKVYSNNEFGFELQYPGDWKIKEYKPSGNSVRSTMVCFGVKKCESDEPGKGPEARLNISDLKSVHNLPVSNQKAEKADKNVVPEKTECDTIENSNLKWGGRKSPWVTLRCEEKKKWRYTTTVTMQRKGPKGYDLYSLKCSMLADSKDKTDSLEDYKKILKPRCEKIFSSTKFN